METRRLCKDEPRLPVVALMAAAVTTLLAFTLCALVVLPATYLLDSSEFVATTWSLGASHPPGHPAFHLLSRLATALPVGTIALRIHLASAAAMALSGGLMIIAAGRWGWIRTRSQAAAATTIALIAVTASGIFFQSIRAEVYALQLLTVAALTALLARTEHRAPDARESFAAGVILGVGLLNHHYLAVLFSPALVIAVGVNGWRHPGEVVRSLLAAVLGAACMMPGYTYLLAVGARDVQSSWGWPANAADLWWFVSAEPFQKTLGTGSDVALSDRVDSLVGVLVSQIGPATAALSAAGVALLATRQAAVAVYVTVAVVLNVASVVGLDPDESNPDQFGYLMTSIWMLALPAVYSVTRLAAWANSSERRRIAPIAASTVIVLVCVGATLRPGALFDYGRYWQSDAVREAQLGGLPPDAIFATGYFETTFNLWHGRETEDERPDVAIIPRPLLTHATFDRAARQHLEVSELFSASRGGALDAGAAAGRPVFVEVERIADANELRCGQVAGFALRLPHVPGAGACPDGTGVDDPVAAAGALRAALDSLPRPFERQTARNVMWAGWNLANAMCKSGRPRSCGALVEVVLPLSPGDPDLLALREEARAAVEAQR